MLIELVTVEQKPKTIYLNPYKILVMFETEKGTQINMEGFMVLVSDSIVDINHKIDNLI